MSSVETMRSWPRHVRSIAEVPWEFKDAFMAAFDYENDFPYCIYIPEGAAGREPPRMLCMLQDSYTLFESCGRGDQPIVYPLKDIYRMEHGQILLSSWLEVGGLVDGKPSVHRITFNTVKEELFKPFFKRFRRIHTPERGREQNHGDKFDFLVKVSYKFLNYGKDALLEGEEAAEVLHQPGIRARIFKKLPIKKSLCNGSLFIRTDTELILLREQSVKHATARYGVITDYIPLSTIRKAWTGESRYQGVTEWTVELKNGEQLKTYIQDENKARIGAILREPQYMASGSGVTGAYH